MITAHLSHVALRTADVPVTRRFYEDVVGLRSVTAPEGRARLALASGAHVLELTDGQGLDHFGVEVESGELRRLEEALAAAGVEATWTEGEGEHPAALRFHDPGGHAIEAHERTDRSGEGTRTDGRRPIGLHHITLTAPDVPALAAFYTDVLGFAVSDRMGDFFMWLRCNHEHHTVAIVQGPEGGLDHYCYEVADWQDLKVWCDTLATRDVLVSWGPGRHGPGNNLFIMFDDPDGVHIELSCEMERFWDDRVTYGAPRDWAQELRTVNLWGPAPEWRRPIEDGTAAPAATA